ncbi:MAG: hypothetical protein EPO21_19110 [Chloroflexota bacterium]|nr:MAG: hypothetical protein EPO21_19110 [Chloroflexota bacterium]
MATRSAQRQAADVLRNRAKWPTLSKTARLIQVHPSTLNKQVTEGRIRYVRLGLGRGTLHVPPVEVLRLAEAFGRTTVENVRSNLAHEVAKGSSLDEAVILQELVNLCSSPEEGVLGTLRPSGIDTQRGDAETNDADLQLSSGTPVRRVVRREDRRDIPPLPATEGDIPTVATVRNIHSAQAMPLEGTVRKRGVRATRKAEIYPGMQF